MDTQTKRTMTVNGVNVDKLHEIIDHIKTNPMIAKFRFNLANEWVDGSRSRSTVEKFHGACEDINHKKTFVIDSDDPEIILGTDTAPGPGEYLLKALAACVTGTIAYHAAARGIRIEEMETTVSGNVDLQGFLGLRDDVRPGYQNIQMDYRIKADVSDEELQELCNLGPTYSPMFDSITKGVPVTVTATRK